MDQVKSFSHYFEVENREAYNPDAFVTITNFSKLIGAYDFDDQVICQVEKNGGKCGHPHNKGWLGVTTAGDEVLIGGFCAKKYFKADNNFIAERNRINRELELIRYNGIIDKFLAQRADIEKEVDELHKSVKTIRLLQTNMLNSLPNEVSRFLEIAEKTKNYSVSIDIKYVETDKETNKTYTSWVTQNIGNIKNAGFIDRKKIASYYEKLSGIKTAFTQIDSTSDKNLQKLKKWAETFSSLELLRKDITESITEYQSFITTDNLNLLLLTTTNRTSRKTIVELISVNNPSETIKSPTQYVSEFEATIREEVGGREFRLSQ
ncbi:hypothetical protein ACLK5F_004403 [Vibrio fluvialis]|uniref:hypothetical protein n=1 Tax=Vibrio TaxID=662 RepID=UPI001302892C|nr:MULTISPECIES: hypothetical protein [Vibrio]MBY7811402.1 hypothetical protein [Vibrio fluvialis]